MTDLVKVSLNKDGNTPVGKKKGKKSGRQRVKKVDVNFTIAGSENKEPLARSAPAEEKHITPRTSVSSASMTINKDRKEDYWYYDPISDGFYYENNGSRGWKKHNPKMHGPPATPKKLPDLNYLNTSQDTKERPWWDTNLEEKYDGFDVDKFIADVLSFDED